MWGVQRPMGREVNRMFYCRRHPECGEYNVRWVGKSTVCFIVGDIPSVGSTTSDGSGSRRHPECGEYNVRWVGKSTVCFIVGDIPSVGSTTSDGSGSQPYVLL